MRIEFYKLLITVPLKMCRKFGWPMWILVRQMLKFGQKMTNDWLLFLALVLWSTRQWLRPFVGNHTKQIVVGGSYSSCSSVSSGVLRGSALGHVLFLLCINDITTDINSQLCLLADDCLIYWLITLTADHQILQTLWLRGPEHGKWNLMSDTLSVHTLY